VSRTLHDVVAAARESAGRQRAAVSEPELRRRAEERAATGGGTGRLVEALSGAGVALVAEVKGASPISGPLVTPFRPLHLAESYADNGAAAISVLTEERFFAGRIEYLEEISEGLELPTLRKDFVVEPYQIWGAATAGAGAVLLIAELLDGSALGEFVEMARSVGLDALVEFHRRDQTSRVVESGSGLVGVNNRDLDTLEVDAEHVSRVAPDLPPGLVTVAESAIVTGADVRRVGEAGYDAVLVGTSLVTSRDPGAKVRELVEAGRDVAAGGGD